MKIRCPSCRSRWANLVDFLLMYHRCVLICLTLTLVSCSHINFLQCAWLSGASETARRRKSRNIQPRNIGGFPRIIITRKYYITVFMYSCVCKRRSVYLTRNTYVFFMCFSSTERAVEPWVLKLSGGTWFVWPIEGSCWLIRSFVERTDDVERNHRSRQLAGSTQQSIYYLRYTRD